MGKGIRRGQGYHGFGLKSSVLFVDLEGKVFPSEKNFKFFQGKAIHAETPTFREAAEAQKILDLALISHRENNRWVEGNEVD